MIEIFGVSLTVSELLTILSVLSAGIGAYYNLNSKVTGLGARFDHLEDRNRKADEVARHLQQDLVSTFTDKHAVLESRVALGEERIRSQEMAWVRVDERLVSMQAILEELRNRTK